MDSKLTDSKLSFLMEVLSNKSFYLLGAGASVNYVPTTTQFKNKIIEYHRQLGAYSAQPIKQDALTQRIIGEIDTLDFYLSRISPNYLRDIILYESSKHHYQKINFIPNYDVFNFVKKPSTIFTTNYDNLAKLRCTGHYVINAHGQIPKNYGSQKKLDFIQDFYSMFDNLRCGLSDDVVFFEEEPRSILSRREYELAKQMYSQSKYLVLIGYSFGWNGFSFDDKYTYEHFFHSLPKQYFKLPTLVISLDTYELVEQIKDTIKSKNVSGLVACWNTLSKSLIDYSINANHKKEKATFLIRKYYDRYLEDKL